MSEKAIYPRSWVRAMMPTAILMCLANGSLHGYAIAQSLGGRGFGVPTGGSLYPVLTKLEQDGLVHTRWVEGVGGPGRKIYSLTEKGAQELRSEQNLLNELISNLSSAPAKEMTS
ncbi:PadR family transcriptional regulator [Arcanobacterium haemolyticum]|nr:PadR family transcriptional regulator [Arcanobacterium haemolyticum]